MPNPGLNPKAIALMAAILASVLMFMAPSPAGAQASLPDAEAQFIVAVNAERAAVGAPPLIAYATMTDSAREWTLDMATREVLEHASNITGGVPPGWTSAGENVGRGGTVNGLMHAFMQSEGHRSNLLNSAYTHIGVGAYVTEGNVLYTTHRFAAAPAATEPTPAPVPPTPVPPTPVPPTPTPIPPTPSPVPPTPTATPAPTPTAVPATPTPVPDLGGPPEFGASVDGESATSSWGLNNPTPPPSTHSTTTTMIIERFSWLIDLLIRLFGSK